MNDYFDDYLAAKLCLFKMISQFYSVSMSIGMAKNVGIELPIDCMEDEDRINVCFHDYKGSGQLAWDLLGLDRDYIPLKEIWELEYGLKYEVKDEDIDYYEIYLRMCVLIIDMILIHYSTTISIDSAKKSKIIYDEEIDERGNDVEVCYNLCQTAGECAWTFFNVSDGTVGKSIFENKRKYYASELYKLSKSKVRKKENKE